MLTQLPAMLAHLFHATAASSSFSGIAVRLALIPVQPQHATLPANDKCCVTGTRLLVKLALGACWTQLFARLPAEGWPADEGMHTLSAPSLWGWLA